MRKLSCWQVGTVDGDTRVHRRHGHLPRISQSRGVTPHAEYFLPRSLHHPPATPPRTARAHEDLYIRGGGRSDDEGPARGFAGRPSDSAPPTASLSGLVESLVVCLASGRLRSHVVDAALRARLMGPRPLAQDVRFWPVLFAHGIALGTARAEAHETPPARRLALEARPTRHTRPLILARHRPPVASPLDLSFPSCGPRNAK